MEGVNYYENLSNAIIIQAVKDFQLAYRQYLKNPNNKVAQQEVKSQSRFFTSDWYSVLTDLDGEKLLKGVMEQERQRMKEKEKKDG